MRGGVAAKGDAGRAPGPERKRKADGKASQGKAKGSRAEPRGGREHATEKMLDAAAQLFSQRGYDRTSVRDIARRAGVSHTLVHRYLGSKEKVLAAVMRRNDERLLESARDVDDLTATALRILGTDRETRVQHMRLVAAVASGGVPLERLGVTFPTTGRLFELAARASAEAAERGEPWPVASNVLVAGMVTMAIGWSTTQAWLPAVMGLEDPEADLEALVALLIRACEGEKGAGASE